MRLANRHNKYSLECVFSRMSTRNRHHCFQTYIASQLQVYSISRHLKCVCTVCVYMTVHVYSTACVTITCLSSVDQMIHPLMLHIFTLTLLPPSSLFLSPPPSLLSAGVDPSCRSNLWKFLFGIYPMNSTYR